MDMKTARFFRGLTQAKLGKMAGVQAPTVSRIENDLLPNTPAVVAAKHRIALALQIPVASIFPGLEAPAAALAKAKDANEAGN